MIYLTKIWFDKNIISIFASIIYLTKIWYDKNIISIIFINMLQKIYNLLYPMYFRIFKYESFKLFLFTINLYTASSFHDFNNYNLIFLSNVLLIRINKFISFLNRWYVGWDDFGPESQRAMTHEPGQPYLEIA